MKRTEVNTNGNFLDPKHGENVAAIVKRNPNGGSFYATTLYPVSYFLNPLVKRGFSFTVEGEKTDDFYVVTFFKN
jgi:hypothetical protein